MSTPEEDTTRLTPNRVHTQTEMDQGRFLSAILLMCLALLITTYAERLIDNITHRLGITNTSVMASLVLLTLAIVATVAFAFHQECPDLFAAAIGGL